MARKRQVNQIRTDYLENWIGFHRAHHNDVASAALTKIARDIGAPIDVEEIERAEKMHSPWALDHTPA